MFRSCLERILRTGEVWSKSPKSAIFPVRISFSVFSFQNFSFQFPISSSQKFSRPLQSHTVECVIHKIGDTSEPCSNFFFSFHFSKFQFPVSNFQFPISSFQFPKNFDPANQWLMVHQISNFHFPISVIFFCFSVLWRYIYENKHENAFQFPNFMCNFHFQFSFPFFHFSVSNFHFSVSNTQPMRFFQFPVSKNFGPSQPMRH